MYGSTLVSNELGVGRSQATCLAVYVVFFMKILEVVLVGCLFFSIQNVWGYAFSNEKEVIDYFASMIPLLAANSILDAIQGTLLGSKLLSYFWNYKHILLEVGMGTNTHFLLINGFLKITFQALLEDVGGKM